MPEPRPWIVHWNPTPSPYVEERFNAVASRANLDLEVWFSRRNVSDPGWRRRWKTDESTWQFRYRYLPQINLGHKSLALPSPLLSDGVPALVCGLYSEPLFLPGCWLARKRGSRIGLWVEATFDNAWAPRRRWKELLKRRAMPRGDGILTTGPDGRSYARRYGARDERIHVVRQAIDVEYFACESAKARLSPVTRESLRLHGVVFLFVGRLWWGKGLSYLLHAFRQLQQSVEYEVSLLLVGDGPEESLLRAEVARMNLGNVVFAGFRQKDQLPQYYGAADIFVFPTLGDPYGLVVDEAMACSLPIISTNMAGEIKERVESGVNGYLVPPKDPAALYDSMVRLASDKSLRIEMGRESAQRVAGCNPDRWASDYENAVARILSSPRATP